MSNPPGEFEDPAPDGAVRAGGGEDRFTSSLIARLARKPQCCRSMIGTGRAGSACGGIAAKAPPTAGAADLRAIHCMTMHFECKA